MANIVVSVPQNTITVDSTTNRVNVAQTTNQITVSEQARTSNTDIRAALSAVDAGGLGSFTYSNLTGVFTYTGPSELEVKDLISVTDTGGDGSLSYSNTTGVFTYTGPSASEVRDHFSATAPVEYSNVTGVFSIDEDAIFTGKTTDDLAEGSTNFYFTPARVRSNISLTVNSPAGDGLLQYNNTTGVFTFTPADVPITTDELTEGSTNLYLNGAGTTDDLAEGSANLWYTEARFDTSFATKDTDDLAEGSTNLYYDEDRIYAQLLEDLGPMKNQSGGGGVTETANVPVIFANISAGNIQLIENDVGTRRGWRQPQNFYNDVRINYPVTGLANENHDLEIYNDGELRLAPHTSNGGRGRVVTSTVRMPKSEGGSPISNSAPTVDIVNDDTAGFRITTGYGGSFGASQHMGNISANANIVIESPYGLTTDSIESYSAGNLTINSNTKITDTLYLDNIRPVNDGNVELFGNLNVSGNLNYVNVEDLLVNDQSITLNYGNASARDVFIISDRSGSTLTNVAIKWNETTDKWQFSNDGVTYEDFISSTTAPVISVNTQTGAVVLDTDDISEGTTNKYYATSLFNTDFATKTTTDLTEGANLYYTDARFDTRFATKTTTDLTEGANLYYTQGRFDTAFAGKTTTDLTEGANLYYTTDRANAAIADYDGDINTAGNITAEYITATGEFLGDLDGAVSTNVFNDTAGTLNKGEAVYLTGGNQGDKPHVDVADNTNAAHMPALGIVKENIGASSEGQVVTSGVMNFSSHGFTQGADLYVNGSGDLTETIPTSEAELIQKIGKVVSPNHIIVQGAFRTNATPNLDQGNIFIGDSTNVAGTGDFTTLVRSNISVATDLTYDQANGIIGLSNVLTGVDTIRTDNNSEFKENSAGDFVITKTFAVNSTSSETANIQGDGFAIYTGNDGSFNNNFNFGNWLAYSGTDDLRGTAIKGNVTAGSNQITVSDTRTGFLVGAFDGSPTMSKITEYMAWENGGAEQNSYPFPPGAYVTAVDAVNNLVTMSEVAKDTVTFDHVTQGGGFMNAIVDTDVGQVYAFLTQLDTGGGSPSVIFVQQVMVPDNYGYPDSGPVLADFDQASFTDTTNLTLASLSNFMKGRTALTPDFTAIKAKDGIAIGANASLSTRAEGDFVNSFGLNILWDGQAKTAEQNPNMINQVLMKHYTDDSYQSTTQGLSIGGPRLLFVGANGNSSQIYAETYPRESQEIGRIGWWGTHKENAIPVSQYPPAFISVQAHDDWDKPGHIGTGPGGNADVYMTGTSDAATNAGDLFMSYHGGELTLASGKPNGQAPITLAPAQQPSNNLAAGAEYANPSGIYAQKMTWANINYANTTSSTGSQFAVTNSEDRSGNDGDYVIGLLRNNNNYTQTFTATGSPFSGGGLTAGATFYPKGAVFSFIPADSFYFGGQLSGLSDGDQITVRNATGSVGTFFNGNSYYVQYNSGLAGFGPQYDGFYGLYSDAALTTPINSGEATAIAAGEYELIADLGIEKSHWKFTLPSGSNSMIISEDDVTHSTFHENGNLDVVGDLRSDARITAGANLDVTTGDLNVSSGDLIVSGTISGSVSLQKFSETVVALGSQSGDISASLDADNGSIYSVTATGGITINSIANAVAGTSMTIIITQGGAGSHTLTSSMKYAGGNKTLSTAATSIDIISVFYDGTTYYASLTAGYA